MMGTIAFCNLLDIPGKVEVEATIGVDVGMVSSVEDNVDILVEAVVELGVDSTAVVGG